MKRFADIAVGDQLELPAGASPLGVWGDRDPDMPYRVGIVTHIWDDPVEGKTFVGIALIRRDGTYGEPTEKRTITGLARAGWRRAQLDWIARAEAMAQADVLDFSRRPKRPPAPMPSTTL